MTSSLLSVINGTEEEEEENQLFEQYTLLQNNALLQQQSSDFTVSGLSSSNVNLLGNRFQTFYDTEQ